MLLRRKAVAVCFIIVSFTAALGPCYAAPSQPTLYVWSTFNTSSPQIVEDEWFVGLLQEFEEARAIRVENEFQNYDQLGSKLNLAVKSGGSVPDLAYVHSQQLAFYARNETLRDLTDFVTSAAWYSDLDPVALEACTGPDGRIYSVPLVSQSRLVYYWTEAWPEGFPSTTSEFLSESARLQEDGLYALTFKGSERDSAEGTYFALVHAYGGTYVDADGNAAWASEETADAIRFVRVLAENDYVPEVVFAAGWENERPFMDGTAAAFGAASWSYHYLYPLTSPSGIEIDFGFESALKALDEGILGLAPYFAPEGRSPSVLVSVPGLGIPVGAEHEELAMDFIDFIMGGSYVAGFGLLSGGLPALVSLGSDPRYQTEYWQFVKWNQDSFGRGIGALSHFDKAVTLLAETITRLVLNPTLDIMAELQSSQDAYNVASE